MTTYLSKQEYATLKRKLTVALKSKRTDRVINACAHAVARFDDTCWPDDWARWQRALTDVPGLLWADLNHLRTAPGVTQYRDAARYAAAQQDWLGWS